MIGDPSGGANVGGDEFHFGHVEIERAEEHGA